MKVISLIKRFINWLKNIFVKRKPQAEPEILVQDYTDKIPIKRKIIDPISESIKVGERWHNESGNICIKMSKLSYVEFKKEWPVTACYRTFYVTI